MAAKLESRHVFDLIPVIPEVKGNLSSFDVAGNHVYIGTDEGRMLHYYVDYAEQADRIIATPRIEKSRTLTQAGKSVEQVVVRLHFGFVFALCDGLVYILDLVNMENIQILPDKGVLSFTLDRKPDSSRLVLLMKKKLLVYDFGKTYTLSKELFLPEPPLDMALYDNSLACAFKREYSIIYLDGRPSNELHRVTKTDKKLANFEPMVMLLGTTQELLVVMGVENLGFFVSLDGNPTRAPLTWASYPRHLAHGDPYILSLSSENTIDIYSLIEEKWVQRVPASRVIAMSDGCVATASQRSAMQPVYAATSHVVSILTPTPLRVQMNDLINAGLIDDAFGLYETAVNAYTPHKEELLYDLHATAGFQLWKRLKFVEASLHFVQAGKSFDPRELIALFPDAKSVYSDYVTSSVLKPFLSVKEMISAEKPNLNETELTLTLSIARHCCVYILFYSRPEHSGNSDMIKAIDTALVKLLCDADPKSLESLLYYFVPMPADDTHVPQWKQAALTVKPPTVIPSSSSSSTAPGSKGSLRTTTKAMDCVKLPDTPVVLEGMKLPPPLACDVDELEPYMRSKNRYFGLAALYRCRDRVLAALQVWQDMLGGKLTEAKWPASIPSALLMAESSKEEEKKRRAATRPERPSDAQMRDPCDEMLECLRVHPMIDVIFNFTKTVYGLLAPKTVNESSTSDVGFGHGLDRLLRVFTERPPSLPLDHAKVLKFLAGLDEGPDRLDHMLAQDLRLSYLEYIVFEGSVTDAGLHTELGKWYVDMVKTLSECDAADAVSPKSRVVPGDEQGLLGVSRKKLIKFLRISQSYDAKALLERIRETRLYEERVLLHARLREDHDAIALLMFKLNDDERAESYCINRRVVTWGDDKSKTTKDKTRAEFSIFVGDPSDIEISVLLCVLVDVNLHPTEGMPREEEALGILQKYGDIIKIHHVLNLLPDNWPISRVQGFLTRAISRHTSHLLNSAVFLSLSKSEAKRLCTVSQGRNFVLNQETSCAVCRRLLDDKVFALFPKCLKRTPESGSDLTTCPVTGQTAANWINLKTTALDNYARHV